MTDGLGCNARMKHSHTLHFLSLVFMYHPWNAGGSNIIQTLFTFLSLALIDEFINMSLYNKGYPAFGYILGTIATTLIPPIPHTPLTFTSLAPP